MEPKNKAPKDVNQIAFQTVQKAVSQEFKPEDLTSQQISQFMAHLGRKGGLKGGKVRAEKLTPEQRRKIAKKAAKKRWSNKS